MSPQRYITKAQIRVLFQELGVIYRPRTRIDWEPLLALDLSKTAYYQDHKAVFEDLAARYGPAIEAETIAPIYIQKIDETIGYGVFAAQPIKEKAFIGEYAGVVQISGKYTHCYQAESGFESDYSWYYLDQLDRCPPLEINGRYEGNEMRLVNHGVEANLQVEHTLWRGQWVLFFLATRDIAPDEQLLIHYGQDYWEDGYREKCDLGT